VTEQPFWRVKTLEQLDPREWESLCDRCGRCCLVKLEEEDSGEVFYTDVACTLFDAGTCQCANYPKRNEIVSDCVRLTPEAVRSITWLPPTCGYRRVAEGKDLPNWHPLKTGDPDSVRAAGISLHGRDLGREGEVEIDDLPDRVVDWPLEVPSKAKRWR
jgi:uncharacterized protein